MEYCEIAAETERGTWQRGRTSVTSQSDMTLPTQQARRQREREEKNIIHNPSFIVNCKLGK